MFVLFFCLHVILILTSNLCLHLSIGKIQSTTRRRRIPRANSEIRVDVVVWNCSDFFGGILYERSLFG
jgi:uncharacterized membrane protein